MIEAEWLAWTDPERMLHYLGTKATKRKCLLFACACERRLWDQPDCDRDKVEVTERYADGKATAGEMLAVLEGIDGISLESITEMDPLDWAIYGSGDSAEFAANVAKQGQRMNDLESEQAWNVAYRAEQAVQSVLIRDIFGNPFRPATITPSCLAWKDGIVAKLIQAVYDERAFDRLPILADALEEAGCDNATLLSHCRGPGPHARGCWVVDLLLNKF